MITACSGVKRPSTGAAPMRSASASRSVSARKTMSSGAKSPSTGRGAQQAVELVDRRRPGFGSRRRRTPSTGRSARVSRRPSARLGDLLRGSRARARRPRLFSRRPSARPAAAPARLEGRRHPYAAASSVQPGSGGVCGRGPHHVAQLSGAMQPTAGPCRRDGGGWAGISLTQNPLLSASMVREVSTLPAWCERRRSPRVSRVMQRVPESGWTGSQPVARWMPRRAVRTTTPIPAAAPPAGAAARWPCPRPRRARRPRAAGPLGGAAHVGVEAAGGDALALVDHGSGPVCPGPRGSACSSSEKPSPPSVCSASSRIATIQASAATAAACRGWSSVAHHEGVGPHGATAEVASVELSSTTTTRSTPAIRRAILMVAPDPPARALAGITTATRSGRCAVSGPAVLIAVVT